MRKIGLGIAMLGALVSLAFASTALANDQDVIRTGACSVGSDWKLKLSPENGRIEVEFEVDQNQVGDQWRVKIRHNGNLVHNQIYTTQGPSGSFEARIVEPNRAGQDAFKARAVNLSTGEVCVGNATANF